MKDGKGYLDLGRVDRDFIDDEKVRKILANTELDSSKMKAFKDQQLRLITSVICSERFEHKGRGATEVCINDFLIFIQCPCHYTCQQKETY